VPAAVPRVPESLAEGEQVPEVPILALREFGVAFGKHVVLAGIRLDVPSRGAFVLLGPAGAGKSTLLRMLAGLNEAQPAFRTWGAADYAGAPLGEGPRPALVMQKARLLLDSVFENLVSALPVRHDLSRAQLRDLAVRLLEDARFGELAGRLDEEVIGLRLDEQRRLAILRTAAAGPALLCVDEPTADLDEAGARAVLDLLSRQAQRRSVLMVTHHQGHARAMGGHAALLCGGRIVECRPTTDLLDFPQTVEARQFVRTGSCYAPSPDACPEDLADDLPPPMLPLEAAMPVSAAVGPRGFRWLKKGVLGGTPRPGIIDDVDYDLEALRRVGVEVLVTLEEDPFPEAQLATHRLEGLHFPVPDMGVPPSEIQRDLCRRFDRLQREQRPVAVHCRAGLGRTGTCLACQLIWDGARPRLALDLVRQIEPRWVQSDAQVTFLKDFAEYLGKNGR
jgi:atypical dual specificity phosphatase